MEAAAQDYVTHSQMEVKRQGSSTSTPLTVLLDSSHSVTPGYQEKSKP